MPASATRRDEAYTYDLYDNAYYTALAGAERSRSHRWRCRWLGEALRPTAGDAIVDLGCGAGLVAKFLAERGARVHGIDLSDDAIRTARQVNATSADCDFHQCDAGTCTHLQPESFDKACSVDVTEHCGYEIMLDIFATAHRFLKPGGAYFVYTPNPLHWIERLKDRGVLKQDPTHTGLRTAAVIRSALAQCGFDVVTDYRPTSMLPGVRWVERLWAGQPFLRQLAIYRVAILARRPVTPHARTHAGTASGPFTGSA